MKAKQFFSSLINSNLHAKVQITLYKNFANTVFIGKSITYLPSCHSTNSVAIEMIKGKTACNGQIIITDNQFAGNGQVGRSWEAEPGKNLTFSIILFHTSILVKNQFDLNMIISLGLLDFLTGLLNARFEIKWPNDILCNNRKVSGILVRNSVMGNQITDSIIGIGLNVNQVNFKSPEATSLKLLTARDFQLRKLIPDLVISIENRYLDYVVSGVDKHRIDYMDNLYRRGELHEFQIPTTGLEFKGEIIGVDQNGRLSVNTGGRIEYFNFNEIKFLL